MTSAALQRAINAPVSDAEMIEAKDEFIANESEKLLKDNLTDLFLELNSDGAKVLHILMTGSILNLAELQFRFRNRMHHEARVMASRLWTQTEAAMAADRIKDGRREKAHD